MPLTSSLQRHFLSSDKSSLGSKASTSMMSSSQLRIQRHNHRPLARNISNDVWVRSRSASDLLDHELLIEQQPHHRHRQEFQRDYHHHHYVDGARLQRPQGAKTEFYRISRRRIIGTVIRAEREDLEREEKAKKDKEKKARKEKEKKQKHQAMVHDLPGSDEGIYLQSESSNSSVARNSEKPILTRHRSADPILNKGWISILPDDVLREMKNGSKCYAADVTGKVMHSEEEHSSDDCERIKHKLRIPVDHPNYCTCLPKIHQKHNKRSSVCSESSRKCVSHSSLVNIDEEEAELRREAAEQHSMSQSELRNYRKVTEERLHKIASYHHLPRVSVAAANASESRQSTPKVEPSPGDVITMNKNQTNSAESNNTPVATAEKSSTGGRYLKNKRQRNRTLTMGIQEMFLPKEPSAAPASTAPQSQRSSSLASIHNDDGHSSSGSDPGICLQFGSTTSGSNARSSTSASSDDDVSVTDSLELNLQLFDDKDKEEAISLAFVEESAAVHSYIASRGQREKEEEIYEVLPTRIAIQKKKSKDGVRYTKGLWKGEIGNRSQFDIFCQSRYDKYPP